MSDVSSITALAKAPPGWHWVTDRWVTGPRFICWRTLARDDNTIHFDLTLTHEEFDLPPYDRNLVATQKQEQAVNRAREVYS